MDFNYSSFQRISLRKHFRELLLDCFNDRPSERIGLYTSSYTSFTWFPHLCLLVDILYLFDSLGFDIDIMSILYFFDSDDVISLINYINNLNF